MKRHLIILLALLMVVGTAISAPVDEKQAKEIGQSFVRNNFNFGRANNDLKLVYTSSTQRGEACFYVFNVGNEGFVIVSGTDAERPILAYSDENTVDVDDMSPAQKCYLDMYKKRISYLVENSKEASSEVKAEWDALRNTGKMISRNGGRAASYLLTTTWDQNNPYNAACPAAAAGPGGHVYAGCVACAMSQVFNFWEYPLQGTGTHTDTYKYNGQWLTVNFSQATYDWDNMPDKLTSSSPAVEVTAVSTLMYHLGVATDMQYAANGSGALSEKVPNAASSYFDYSDDAVLYTMVNFPLATWKSMLKESFDRRWPIYYAARDYEDPEGDGAGHAFVCDGYDDNDFFHFNWGWHGSGDGFYSLSAPQAGSYVFNDDQRAVFNLVPSFVYDNTAKAPSNITATAGANNALTVNLAWKNPTQTMNGSSLSFISQIVIERNGVVVNTINNPSPGQNMTWVDNVPCFSTYKYNIYAVVGDSHGTSGKTSVYVGPTCKWTIMFTSNVTQGFRDGYMSVVDATGNEYGQYTTTTSSLTTLTPQLPLGQLYFVWHAPTTTVSGVTIIIKNPQNANVFTKTNVSSDDLDEELFSYNSACDASVNPQQVENLVAVADASSNVSLTWTTVDDGGYGYNIYKDGVLMAMVTNGNTYTYNEPVTGGHCYYVVSLTDGGEGAQSNVSCVQIDPEGVCCPATNLYYEMTSSNKVKLFWTKPACSNFSGSKCGYYIYKKEGDGEWSYILKGASVTNYTDNSAQIGKTYYYKVIAVYNVGSDDFCEAMPANVKDVDNKYIMDVEVTDGVVESEGSINIYPNPAKDNLNIKGSGIMSVAIYNVVGQMVYSSDMAEDNQIIDLGGLTSGIYMVKVKTSSEEIVKRISVVR